MKDIYVRTFKPEHLVFMNIREEQKDLFESDLQRAWNEEYMKGPAYSVFQEGKLLFCGGIRIFWNGCGEVWFLCSQEALRRKRIVLQYCRVLLEKTIIENNLIRVQAPIKADWEQAYKFAEWFGFRREGLMRKYGPDGADYYIYGRVR